MKHVIRNVYQIAFEFGVNRLKLEMLARRTLDGRRRQADDFGWWVKTTVLFLAVSRPKFMRFSDDVGDLRSFQCRFPIVYIVFLAGDIGPQVATELRSRRK